MEKRRVRKREKRSEGKINYKGEGGVMYICLKRERLGERERETERDGGKLSGNV